MVASPSQQELYGDATSQLHNSSAHGSSAAMQLPVITAADDNIFPDTYAASLAALDDQVRPTPST